MRHFLNSLYILKQVFFILTWNDDVNNTINNNNYNAYYYYFYEFVRTLSGLSDRLNEWIKSKISSQNRWQFLLVLNPARAKAFNMRRKPLTTHPFIVILMSRVNKVITTARVHCEEKYYWVVCHFTVRAMFPTEALAVNIYLSIRQWELNTFELFP